MEEPMTELSDRFGTIHRVAGDRTACGMRLAPDTTRLPRPGDRRCRDCYGADLYSLRPVSRALRVEVAA
jgi:hypothetical protein